MRVAVGILLVCGVVAVGCQNKASGPKPAPAKITKLKQTDTVVGKGKEAKRGDYVEMRYKGTFADGKVFDENKAPDEPFSFKLGEGTVIKGWDQGIPGMKEGGKRRLEIPYELAYGEQGSGPIPGEADLIFDVELLKVTPAADFENVKVKVLKEGSGPAVKKGDKIAISYEIENPSGDLVLTSEGRTVEFYFGEGELLSVGLEAAMEGMKKGEIREIRLPSAMAVPSGEQSDRMDPQIAKITLVKIL